MHIDPPYSHLDAARQAKHSRLTYATEQDPLLQQWCIRVLESVSGQRRINRIYAAIQTADIEDAAIWQYALDGLRVTPGYDPARLQAIPREGPVVFIANHPFGIVDGLMLAQIIASVRPKFAVLVNHVLCGHDPRIEQHLLPVNFGESKAAIQTNIQTKQEALARLARGEAIGIFPSGGVATAPGGWGKAQDVDWKRFTAKIIQMSRATVVPIYFHGQNSRLFHLVSQFSTTLRLGLLICEANNKKGRTIPLSIGDPIPYESLAAIRDRQALIDHLRTTTFNLAPDARP